VVDATTMHGGWSTIESMYPSSSQACIMRTRMQLAAIQKGDLSTVDHFRKMVRINNTLAAIGKRLEDEEFIWYPLCGLPSDYDSLITSITTRTDAYAISNVYAHLLNYETMQEQYNALGQVSSANNANRVAGHGGGNPFGHSGPGVRGHGSG
jgi:hypothetical protein